MGYYVPETLQKLDNWVLWRLEDTGKGKPSKVPYSPITGRRASTIDRRTWGSYDEAVMRLEYGDFSGLGFVFTEAEGLVFIDLDNCFTPDGEETEFAKEVQALFPGCYMEISQSEKGIHIVCKGHLPRAIKREEIEVYSWGRYMAFTGNATSGAEPQEAQAGINALIQRYAPTEPQKAPQRAYTGSNEISEEKLLELILNSRQGEKFAKLLSGDITGYKSQSEADMAFIAIANAFSNGDDSLIWALWQRSKLSERRKGARPDYITRTIESAKRTHTGSKTKTSNRNNRIVCDVVKPKKRRVPVR